MDTITNENLPIARHLEYSREVERTIHDAAPQNAAKAEYRKGIDEVKDELRALRQSTDAQFKCLLEALPGIVEAAFAKQLEHFENDLELGEDASNTVLSTHGDTPLVAPANDATQAPNEPN